MKKYSPAPFGQSPLGNPKDPSIATENTIRLEIMGRSFRVPAGITAIDALWLSGYPLVKGVGCLAGICGACTIFYTTREHQEFRVALGCRTVVEDGMAFSLIPRSPLPKGRYRIQEIQNPARDLRRVFRKVETCVHCHGCTNVCPQEIQVEQGVERAVAGDWAAVAEMGLSCIMCGLCLSTCVAELEPNHVLLFARRVQATQLPAPPDLAARIREIQEGVFEEAWREVLSLDEADLRELAEQGRDL